MDDVRPSPLKSARQSHNALSRHRGANDPATREAYRRLCAEHAAVYIAEVMADAPPMSDELKARLRDIFRPVLAVGD